MDAFARSVALLAIAGVAAGCGGGGGGGAPPPPGCTFTLSASGAAAAAAGETATFDVTAADGCAWTATSDVGWIAVVGGAAGTGAGTVRYRVEANGTALERAGTITAGGRQFAVTQAGAACTYALTPVTSSFTAAAQGGTLAVDTLAGCPWTAASDDVWLAIVSGASGNGDGTVQFSVAENAGTGSRSGTLTVAGRTFTVSQGGALCDYAVSPASAAPGAGASTGSFGVTAPAGCGWTAGADVPWIAVTSGAGAGNGTVAYAVAANASTAERTGTVSVAGQAHTVTQAGAACTYALLPASGSYPPAGSFETVTVSAPQGCPWSASSEVAWVTITAGSSGDGTGSVSFEVAANSGAGSRSTTLDVAGQPFAVSQGGAGCTYSISPESRTVGAAGEAGTLAVTAPDGCAWTAASGVPWLTFTSTQSGSGSGSVDYEVAPNAATSERTGAATVAGQTFTVTQDPAPCTFALSSGKATFSAAASSSAFSVTTTEGCAWTAVSNDPDWLAVTSGASGTGPGLVGFAVEENGGDAERTGTLTAGGQTFTVVQDWGSDVIIIVQ